jgi:hypothetical protein
MAVSISYLHPRDDIHSLMLRVYDRLEVIESTAEAIINCRAIGALVPAAPIEAVTRRT